MINNWLKVVSFKTELLSEATIHHGYRESIPKLLPNLPPFRNRMIIDNDIYIDLNETNKIQEYLSNNIVKKAEYIYSVIESQSRKLLSVTSNIENFFVEYQKTVGMIGIPTVIDLELEKQLIDELSKEINNPDEFISEIAIPYKPIETFKEKEELFNIAIYLKEKKLDLNSEESNRLIEKHQKEYGWIHSTLFLGDEYSVKDITKELKEVLGNDPVKEKDNLEKERKVNLDKSKEKISSLKSEKVKELAELFQKAIYYRTIRLEWVNKACFKIKPELVELANSLGVTFDEIIYLLPEELIKVMKSMALGDSARSEISERMKKYAFISDNEREYKLLVGIEVDEWKKRHQEELEEQAEIKGISASKGVVTGKVVIVKDRSELSKVQVGDILVTPLTTPDFVVAMKKSSAIVTDLGGITSHASIVSRELKKPCIIGTKIATQVLKDGMEVEVDANEGVVRIL